MSDKSHALRGGHPPLLATGSCRSSSRASVSKRYSSSTLPQLWPPAPPLRRALSIPDLDSDLSLIMARGERERSVRVMMEGVKDGCSIGRGLYRRSYLTGLVTSCGSKVSAGPSHKNNKMFGLGLLVLPEPSLPFRPPKGPGEI